MYTTGPMWLLEVRAHLALRFGGSCKEQDMFSSGVKAFMR